ncbi:MAG TPA: NAD(P)/FAD-dependent oxidoreductase [Gaiellaceae bacterium]|nr:NAD(P)/FAD-dependent oxidoreductase [Gaiellaceae bacterium]
MDDRSASMLELKALHVPHGHYDVAVLGGGLAGLSIALQIKRQRPDTRVLVTDKRAEPAPDAAFKVGESSVEIGAHYYREVVGMRDHLEQAQLRKLGLRFMLPAGDNSDITKRVEFCTPAHLAAFTHQIDRGRFENELFRRCLKNGAEAFRGWRVQDVEIGSDAHTVKLSQEDEETSVTARWIVDATGRANFLRRKLDLVAETGHHINAAWIRLAGGLDFEEWGADDEEWLDRMPERGLRHFSTTHLIDEGYWLWMIQLATGPVSIGVCADPRFHPWEEIESFEAFMEWCRAHEPLIYNEIDGRREDVLDFLRVKDFSYASTRVYSPERWALVGEAGGFIDAFYSPGSDFIAFSNTFATELICHDLDGGEAELDERVEFYNDFYFKLFNPTIHLYRDNYHFFSNPQVMVAKVVWDSLVYFTVLGSPFVHGKLAKKEDIEKFSEIADMVVPVVPRMQELFRDWHALDQTPYEGVSVLSRQLKPYIWGQEEIGLPGTDDELLERARQKVQTIRALAVWIFFKAARNLPDPPDENVAVNPFAVSLHPERWEEDGLFSGDGLTLAQALEQLPGIEEMDLEACGAVVAG